MYSPVLLKDRPRPVQIVLGGVVPAVSGAIAGILVGVSGGAYWGYGAVVAVGSVIAGFVYGVALLIAHAIAGTHAKVSLGSFPPLLAVVTAIIGMLLSALGGYLARTGRERAMAGAGDEVAERSEG
jgi:hypothetical protein